MKRVMAVLGVLALTVCLALAAGPAAADPPQQFELACADVFGPDVDGKIKFLVASDGTKVSIHCRFPDNFPMDSAVHVPCSDLEPGLTGDLTITPSGNVNGNCRFEEAPH